MPFGELPEHTWSLGGPVDDVRLTLRVAGENLDPQMVTSLLGIVPTTAFSKGDRSGAQKAGVWLYETSTSTGDLDALVTMLLGRLPTDSGVWAKLGSLGKADVYCGLHLLDWSRGTSLAPGTMAALAARSLTLELDIYCSPEDVEPDA